VRELRTRGDQVAMLIADQRMPGMPGTQYLVEARKIAPDAKRVLLTAYADTLERECRTLHAQFVEGRDYVDHLTDLKLYHSFDGPPRDGIGSMRIGVDFFIRADPQPAIAEMMVGDDFVVGRGVEVAETTQPHAILVSHAEHLITPVAAGSEVCPGVARLGIGYMTVGLDFIVQLEPAP